MQSWWEKPRPHHSLAESIRKEEEEHKAAAVEEPVAKNPGEEEKKTEDGKRRKQKKQYTAADFKFPPGQPLLKIHAPNVYCSRKWFNRYHPLIEF